MSAAIASRTSAILDRAYASIWVALVAVALAVALGIGNTGLGSASWLTLASLAVAGLLADALPSGTRRRGRHEMAVVFIAAAVLLLPPAGVALVVLATQAPRLARQAYLDEEAAVAESPRDLVGWLAAALVARAGFASLGGIAATGPQSVIEAPLATLAAMLILLTIGRGVQVLFSGAPKTALERETAGPPTERVVAEVTLCCLGIIAALLWQITMALGLLTLAPLLLARRALEAPDLERLARTDSKTGLYNTRHFSDVLQEEARRSARFGRPFTVVMADLDLLRDVNNNYGHLAGDLVLREVAGVIRDSLREYDTAARFGGEEFVILLPECEAAKGIVVAERLRESVERMRVALPTSARPIGVTMSLGVAAFPAHGATPQDVVHQADLAVYRAKVAGRNRVCSSSDEGSARGSSGESPVWTAPRHPDGFQTVGSPVVDRLLSGLADDALEPASTPDGEVGAGAGSPAGARGEDRTSDRTSTGYAAVPSFGGLLVVLLALALGAVALGSGYWSGNEGRATAQFLIGGLGITAIAASAATRRQIARLSAEVGRLRRDNRELIRTRDEAQIVAHRLARQVGALVEERSAAGESGWPAAGLRDEWLGVIDRAARRPSDERAWSARTATSQAPSRPPGLRVAEAALPPESRDDEGAPPASYAS